MVKSRALEERLIKIHKKGKAFFWIGGPGEEAFGVPLGLLVHKGKGLSYDWLHLHYRATSTLVAMGMPMIEAVRLIMNKSTDSSTGGRNFSSHYSIPKWNVLPVTSPIEVQYVIAIGTAWVQKREREREKRKGIEKEERGKEEEGKKGREEKKFFKQPITIVTGGDAGTHEGDFASSLIWSNRKGNELPLLITVQNNMWGISTPYEEQHSEDSIGDRAKAFKIRSSKVSGNDPIEYYIRLKEEMDYVRKTGRPAFFEAQVSRLYGHSSSSGASFVKNELDGLKDFENFLLKEKVLTEKEVTTVWKSFEEEGVQAENKVEGEPYPHQESLWDHSYTKGENADWRFF